MTIYLFTDKKYIDNAVARCLCIIVKWGGTEISKIHNEPKITFPVIQQVRSQLEQRAIWLYLLTDEAEKRGLPKEEFASAAIRRCGLWQGEGLVKKGGTKSLKGL